MTEPTPYRIAVGEGSPEGENSAYVLPDRRVVVDPGPPTDAAWETLRQGIRRAGLPLAEVADVFVTHWHVDHAGLAPRLADAAGATIHMHEADAPFVESYARARRRRVRRDVDRLATWGVPDERIEMVRTLDTRSPLPDRTDVTAHVDGEIAADVEVVHTPGHTKGHAAFRAGEWLFVGDTVLSAYTPNVGGTDTRLENPLSQYLRTLDELQAHSGTLYPGHGESLEVPERMEAIRSHHRRRTARVHQSVAQRESVTPWDVATELFGELHGIHVKLGAGEAAAHLAHLEDAGRVRRITDTPHRYVSEAAET